MIAIGALNSAHGMGISIPGDVSLVGFDNIPAAACELVGLTTVQVALTSMAEQATELLLSRIADPNRAPLRRTIPTRLVPRNTHGRPR